MNLLLLCMHLKIEALYWLFQWHWIWNTKSLKKKFWINYIRKVSKEYLRARDFSLMEVMHFRTTPVIINEAVYTTKWILFKSFLHIVFYDDKRIWEYTFRIEFDEFDEFVHWTTSPFPVVTNQNALIGRCIHNLNRNVCDWL